MHRLRPSATARRLRRGAALLLVGSVGLALPATPAAAADVSHTMSGPYSGTSSTTQSCTSSSPATTSCRAVATASNGAFDLVAGVHKGLLPDGPVYAGASTTITATVDLPRPTSKVSYTAIVDIDQVDAAVSSAAGYASFGLSSTSWYGGEYVPVTGPGRYALRLPGASQRDGHWVAGPQTVSFSVDASSVVYSTTCSDVTPFSGTGPFFVGGATLFDSYWWYSTCNAMKPPYQGDATVQVRGRVVEIRATYDDGQVFDTGSVSATSRDDAVTLTWAPSGGYPTPVTGYRIKRATSGSPDAAWTVGADVLSITLEHQPRGWSTYTVTPIAGESSGTGRTASVYIRNKPPTTGLQNVTLTSISPACLRWDAITDPVVGWVNVYLTIGATTPFLRQSVGSSTTSLCMDLDHDRHEEITVTLVPANDGGESTQRTSVTVAPH